MRARVAVPLPDGRDLLWGRGVARRGAFCMLRVRARRTVGTVTPRAPAKASRVTEVGNRLRCPASHRLSVTFERWIVSARPALLSPAKNRSRRRSEPRRSGTSRSAGASPSAAARGGSSSGRGCAAPRSHMETRSPPATPTLRASSCWVMPARSRARRSTSWSIVGPVSIATPTLEPGRRPARVKPAAASAWRTIGRRQRHSTPSVLRAAGLVLAGDGNARVVVGPVNFVTERGLG